MLFRIFNRGKFIGLNVVRVNFFTQFTGLMFSRRKTAIRLFSHAVDRRMPIHSWFVFYKFLIVWLDSKKRVVEWRVVKPFTSFVLPRKVCCAFLEIPLDDKYNKEIKFVVGNKQRFKYN